MSEEKKEKWLNYLALTTIVFAVCATLSTFKGGSFSTRSVLSQTQASDQWAFYQAKSIKSYLYEIRKEEMEFDLKKSGDKIPKAALSEYEKRIDAYAQKIIKYDTEKEKIQADARNLEQLRDDAQKHQQAFGVAVIFLQIAILLSSVSALLKKKSLWLVGSATGVAGLIYFANGFFLFIK